MTSDYLKQRELTEPKTSQLLKNIRQG